MPRFGLNLEQFFDQQNRNLSKSSIYSLGIQLLNILEQIHESGYIYNDLKLDNLLIGYNDQLPSEHIAGNCFEYVSISIVDFGFVTRYADETNMKHLPVQNVKVFRGNIMFASPNQLNFRSTSRRDDLISLVYLMIYMLNQGELIGQPVQQQNMPREEIFAKSREAKMAYKIGDLCQDVSEDLETFVQEVFKYTFSEKPNYERLRSKLRTNVINASRTNQHKIIDDKANDVIEEDQKNQ